MYHKVGVPPIESKLKKLWVSPKKFRRQMLYLKRHGYKTVTFNELQNMRLSNKIVYPKTIIITFDDGYRNNFIEAVPILKEFGFPCTIFIVIDGIGKDNFWHDPKTETRVPMLSEAEIQQLINSGFEIGAHTLTHKNLSKIPLEQAKKEITESKIKLENKFKYPICAFAYPYGGGAFNEQLREYAKQAGYSFAVSIKQGKADMEGNPYCLKRIFIRGDDNMFDFSLNLKSGKSRF
jgi:peptidoglycan/xylan/chitin deacetylase (PgdA/CDA1 family)